MVFSSVQFLFYFLPLFFAAYLAARGIAAKNAVLLATSLVFYAWGEPWFVLVLLGQIAFNFFIALAIDVRNGAGRQRTTTLGVGVNLALLGLFKYADFAVGSINAAAGASFSLPGLALPLGISFFTFHSISYLVDVHRGQVRANRSLLQTAVYIAMFPQLVAGPIIRYHTIARRLADRSVTLGRASVGMRIFVIGLAQKILIADEVARIADKIFDHVAAPSLVEAWLGLTAYSVQIYFDFMGYSNMAIGLALAIGLRFPRNFNLPYTSRSIGEFWRRWHISLSQWLRDYLYIPLGGSRGSTLETYRNLVLVFLLCGLWHGANWTFVVWGAHHGLFLILERAGLAHWLAVAPAIVARLYALLAVMSGWVWFRAHDFDHALRFFKGLASGNDFAALTLPAHLALYPTTLGALGIGTMLALWRMPNFAAWLPRRAGERWFAAADTVAIGALFTFAVLAAASGAYSPFLYFRF